MPKKEYDDLMPEELARYDSFPYAKDVDGIRALAYYADTRNMTNLELKEYYMSQKEENKRKKGNDNIPEYHKEITPIIQECKSAKHSVTIINDHIIKEEISFFVFTKDGVELNIISDNRGKDLNDIYIRSVKKTHPDWKIKFKRSNGLFKAKYILIDYGTPDEKMFLYGTTTINGKRGEKIFTPIYNCSDFDRRVRCVLEDD